MCQVRMYTTAVSTCLIRTAASCKDLFRNNEMRNDNGKVSVRFISSIPGYRCVTYRVCSFAVLVMHTSTVLVPGWHRAAAADRKSVFAPVLYLVHGTYIFICTCPYKQRSCIGEFGSKVVRCTTLSINVVPYLVPVVPGTQQQQAVRAAVTSLDKRHNVVTQQ